MAPRPFLEAELASLWKLNLEFRGDMGRIEWELEVRQDIYSHVRPNLPRDRPGIQALQAALYDYRPNYRTWMVPTLRRKPPTATTAWSPRERFMLMAAMVSSPAPTMQSLRETVMGYTSNDSRELRKVLPTDRTIRQQLLIGQQERGEWKMADMESHYYRQLEDTPPSGQQ